jgi:tetratricopeptide (TPR) repeat protein
VPLGEAIRLKPSSGDAWYNLAATYARLQDKAQALAALQRALDVNPALAAEAQHNADFANVHEDPDFVTLTER